MFAGVLACGAGPALAEETNQARGASPEDIVAWAREIQQDYPAAALRNAEQGAVTMRITIGVNGRVSNCEVIQSSESEALDEAACRGMAEHARYRPALDEVGEPTVDIVTQAVRYVLPKGGPGMSSFIPPIAIGMGKWRDLAFGAEFEEKIREDGNGSGTALYALTVDAEGKPSGCGVMQSSGSSNVDNGVCASLLEHAEFEPSSVHGEAINGFFVIPYPSYEALGAVRSQ